MGKKYTLKAVRPDTPPQEAVEIQPVVGLILHPEPLVFPHRGSFIS